MDQLWANRAASAEAAITQRHLRRLWGLPGTQLGVVAWPAAGPHKQFRTWHYWWQAHLLDCLVDAQLREPDPDRQRRITRQIRAHRIRNIGRWTNDYYDDMAWLALALERAGRLAGVARPRALGTLCEQFLNAWVPEDGGGIPWRKQDQFFNAPANGPAGIFLARYDNRLRRAQQMADWIDEVLIDPDTQLVFDGIKGGSLVRAQYTYCQGVVLGLETELAVRIGGDDGGGEHALRVHRLVAAVAEHMAPDGVIKGAGGGDGGLFNGILARYLALVATTLPGDTADDVAARDTARRIVLASAEAAWGNRQTVGADGGALPLFGAFWERTAELPTAAGRQAESVEGAVNASEIPERDLSVQLSGWMLMEAAHAVSDQPAESADPGPAET
ncbi:glycoside hydrolase family 76 protein [Mycolicibacterium monacense]|uniref:Glycosyl hydrolase n=4 Tax=Mycobacteriaceae TaxID=1762 RepID=A0AAD1IYK8_MYCMB|nr:glycoside hydrolase family 76 protein [Mycolicibacterium monacense]MDA4100032.1 fructose-bisphosphate aldolase [Mycolicibacterium monacense DSM 44395]OBB76916.1 fructose-bisphosphate aldolase [Mycolicibacterium monacense]OBF53442.1 fructose-bisphosphate aldolase [Mycolicibacterium monacense]ORB20232.1 fructose-bisphosphate aldolase [Mycolicibacterium monacense DSM 44395]QHP84335.1 fructose-bisphosphate aldolase [Mycolicibacterium monacense DSM 44395]